MFDNQQTTTGPAGGGRPAQTAAIAISAIAEVVREARTRIDDGDLPRALAMLRPVLAAATLKPDAPDADLAEAALLYAGVMTSLGESFSALPYSTYAHHATGRLGDRTAPTALLADLVHAFVLRATTQMTASVALYRDVVGRLDTRCGTAGRPTLAAHADLAITLHAAGSCEAARTTLDAVYLAHRDAFGPADPQGIAMLTRLGSITLDCGGFEQAHQYFDEAKALCVAHLPGGDPLMRTVVSAARAGTNPGHVCGGTATSQQGLQVGDLFINALDLHADDLIGAAPERVDDSDVDPFVSALEMLTSGTAVSITSHLGHTTNPWMSGAVHQLAGSISISGGASYPFTIDAPQGPRNGLPDHVEIRIYAPGTEPGTPG